MSKIDKIQVKYLPHSSNTMSANQLAQSALNLARTRVASIDRELAETRAQAKALTTEYCATPSATLQWSLRNVKDTIVQHILTKQQLDAELADAEYSAQLQLALN